MIGPSIVQVLEASGDSDIAVAGAAAVIYSASFNLKHAEYFSLAYIATSDGVVALVLQLEQSFQLPTTEGAADANWVIPEGMADINAALADETMHIESISPVPMPYARIKISGAGGNDASTTIRLRAGIQSHW